MNEAERREVFRKLVDVQIKNDPSRRVVAKDILARLDASRDHEEVLVDILRRRDVFVVVTSLRGFANGMRNAMDDKPSSFVKDMIVQLATKMDFYANEIEKAL